MEATLNQSGLRPTAPTETVTLSGISLVCQLIEPNEDDDRLAEVSFAFTDPDDSFLLPADATIHLKGVPVDMFVEDNNYAISLSFEVPVAQR
jgi:hypothetical protein